MRAVRAPGSTWTAIECGTAIRLFGLEHTSTNAPSVASRRWRRFLAGEPQFIGGWMELTWCLNMLGEHGEAPAVAHKAVELDPQQPGALANLGGTLLEIGRKAEALVWIDRALALDPEVAITLSLREQAVRTGD